MATVEEEALDPEMLWWRRKDDIDNHNDNIGIDIDINSNSIIDIIDINAILIGRLGGAPGSPAHLAHDPRQQLGGRVEYSRVE